jgi:HEAT repeat protein
LDDVHTVDDLIELSKADKASVRARAVHHMCPCEVKGDVPEIWDRLIAMVDDPDPAVRRWVVHALADGSPLHRTGEIVAALETLWNDPDKKVRKRARFVLNAYRRTGRVNVL